MESHVSRFSKNSLNTCKKGLGDKVERGLTVTLSNDVCLPIFGDPLARMPQKRDIDVY